MTHFAHILLLNELAERQQINLLRTQHKILRDSYNPFHLREYDFITLFRISKDLAKYLIDQLSNEPSLKRKRNTGLSIGLQVCICLIKIL